MKKITISILIILVPLLVSAQKMTFLRSESTLNQSIPLRFSSSSETSTMEWGCPVSEIVQANSQTEALQLIERECVEEVKRAANAKPEVFEVIQASVIWPDVAVKKEEGGYRLTGTFFLETLVLQGAKGWEK